MKSNRRLNQTTQVRLSRFERAVRNHEMAGASADHDEIKEIESEFKAARKSLVDHLIELQSWNTTSTKP